ncbi:multicomponent K+:H+ antiporter subunit C [Sinorhizobium meliloti]
MELILSAGIGTLTASGVYLLLRPRTYQVIIGLSLLSFAVNLFIFGMGRLRVNAPPILDPGGVGDLARYTDPVPQALVLTAIVIGFAMTALFPRGAPRLPRLHRNRPCGRKGAAR